MCVKSVIKVLQKSDVCVLRLVYIHALLFFMNLNVLIITVYQSLNAGSSGLFEKS